MSDFPKRGGILPSFHDLRVWIDDQLVTGILSIDATQARLCLVVLLQGAHTLTSRAGLLSTVRVNWGQGPELSYRDSELTFTIRDKANKPAEPTEVDVEIHAHSVTSARLELPR